MQRLLDKVCVITGAGAGIGKEIAQMFAREGACVVCSSRRESNGRPVSDDINARGGRSVFVKCDISQPDQVAVLFDAAICEYGRVDVLVNNAGVNFDKPFLDTRLSDWDRVIGVDLRGTFMCTQRAIEEMLNRRQEGSIINITSVHTLQCMPGAAPYDAAKWAVVGMTKSLAVEFASKGIRINALSPGLIATQIWDDIMDAAPDKETCIGYWNSNIPAGRPGTAVEVAQAALFLASDESRYFNGSNVLIDGGMTSQLVSKPAFASSAIEGGERK
jgi:NAD(P)-dependent dehydrogenase (short-subunit alcohol dehydrogenase family)